MNAVDEFRTMVSDGPAANIFRALQAEHIFTAISERAQDINGSSFLPIFSSLQTYASDAFVLAVNHLLEREGRKYPLQSVQGVLRYLASHLSEIPLKEPAIVQQALIRLGYRASDFDEGRNTGEIVNMVLDRLPDHNENRAYEGLRILRDKRIAHPERVRAESLPSTTWEDARLLLKIPTEALAICGAHLSDGYVNSQGHLLMRSEAQQAAIAMIRLLAR